MRRILFHHLSKTAGSSLITALNARVEGRTCAARYDFEISTEDFDRPEYRLFHGHFSPAVVKAFRARVPRPRGFVFTFLRHPLDRMLSQYYNWTDEAKIRAAFDDQIQRTGRTPEVEEALAAFEEHIFRMSLSDFLRSDMQKIVDAIDNHYTRYLGDAVAAGGDRARLLQTAMENLEQLYDFYGLKEFYGHSLQALYDLLGFGAYGALAAERETKNLNPGKSFNDKYRVSRADYDLMLARAELDLQFYQYAAGRYLQRYANPTVKFDLAGITGPAWS